MTRLLFAANEGTFGFCDIGLGDDTVEVGRTADEMDGWEKEIELVMNGL